MLTKSCGKCEQSYKLLNGLLHLQPLHYLSVQHDCWPGSSNFKVRRHSNNFLVPQLSQNLSHVLGGLCLYFNKLSIHALFIWFLAPSCDSIYNLFTEHFSDVITFNNFVRSFTICTYTLYYSLCHKSSEHFHFVNHIDGYKHEVESAIYLSRYLCYVFVYLHIMCYHKCPY